MAKQKFKEVEAPKPLKIDIGCGNRKYDGPKGDEKYWKGIDIISFPTVDYIIDIGKDRWPFDDGSVEEAYSSHFVEHLTAVERIHFCNELYRVLVPGGKCTLIVPHWSSSRAYGDPTHQWPPVSEFWFYYLSRKWRLDDGNAPHTDVKHWPKHWVGLKAAPNGEALMELDAREVGGGYSCDFECTWGYGMHPTLQGRNTEYQQFALNFYKEAVQDIHATLTKK